MPTAPQPKKTSQGSKRGSGRGGARPNSGPKAKAVGFREWCRAVVLQPEVLENMAARARTDPEFALRIAEAGFGRPPQALDVAFSGPRTVEVVFGAGVSGVGLGDE